MLWRAEQRSWHALLRFLSLSKNYSSIAMQGAGRYWDPEYDFTFWSSSDWDSVSPDIRVGGYGNFLQASGRDTLEGLQGDQIITASIEIPDRGPGRPCKRTVPAEPSTVDLPASLWQAVDEARGADEPAGLHRGSYPREVGPRARSNSLRLWMSGARNWSPCCSNTTKPSQA